jgi:TRAP-type C4-dicarboxylate transport system permease small subunit
MGFWHRIGQIEGGLASIGGGFCLFLIMMITVLSVLGRYVFGIDLIPGAYNIIERIAFPLLVFWAVPLAHRDGMFPKFDILLNKLPPLLARVLAAFVLVVEIVVFLIIFWFVVRFAWGAVESNRQMQISSTHWPVWPVILMVPLAFGLMLLEMFRLLWVTITAKNTSDGIVPHL